MKRRKHSPEQIIANLREAIALPATSATIGQDCQKLASSKRADDSPLAQPVRRHEGVGRQAPQGDQVRERPAPDGCGGPDAGQRHAQGPGSG